MSTVMDEGLPIAYEVLEPGVPVFASDGEQIGTVAHVVAAPAEDIFHGIVLDGEHGSTGRPQARCHHPSTGRRPGGSTSPGPSRAAGSASWI